MRSRIRRIGAGLLAGLLAAGLAQAEKNKSKSSTKDPESTDSLAETLRGTETQRGLLTFHRSAKKLATAVARPTATSSSFA